MTRLVRAGLLVAAFAAVASPVAVFAQNPEAASPTAAAAQPVQLVPPQSAEQTREQLEGILRLYAPNLRRVLQADPTLLGRTDYLAPYPQLVEFLKQHPEVVRNPTFYFGGVSEYEYRPRSASEVFANVIGGFGFFIGAMTVIVLLASLIRQAIEYRRWLRQARVQADVHTKILDRMGSNEELIAYIESAAGRRFLEAAPIVVEGEARAVNAPIGRILWSVQIGIVLATLGIGLWLVTPYVPAEISPAFSVMTVVAVALGLGTVLSAAVAYLLSSRLGLLPARQAS